MSQGVFRRRWHRRHVRRRPRVYTAAAVPPIDLFVADCAHGHTADALTLTQTHVLAVQETVHTHAADSLTLTQVHDLTVAETVHAHAVDSLILTQGHVLTVSETTHAHAVDALTLTQEHVLTVQDAGHVQLADNVGIAQIAHAPDYVNELGLQGGNTLFWPVTDPALTGDQVIAFVGNKLSSEIPSTPAGWALLDSQPVGTGSNGEDTGLVRVSAFWTELATDTPDPPSFAFTPNVVLCGGLIFRKDPGETWLTPVLTIGNDSSSDTDFSAAGSALGAKPGDVVASFSVGTANVTFTGGRGLVVSGWAVTVTGINSAPTGTGNNLYVWTDLARIDTGSETGGPTAVGTFASATSGGTAFVKVALSDATPLVVQNAAHGHTVDGSTLTQTHVLAVDDALHAHAAESPALTQVHALVVQDALHAQNVDSVTLTQGHVLTVQETVHAQTVDGLALTQVHNLTVQDATQPQTVDGVAITQTHTLVIQDCVHAHAADAVTVTQTHVLQVQDAAHAHAADTLTLTQTHVLAMADAVHAHTVDNVVLVPTTDVDPRGSLWTRTDLRFGSCIGAWEWDGGFAFNDPTAAINTAALGLTIIRYQMWRVPQELGGGQPINTMEAALDDINGIGAIALVGLPPIWNEQYPGQPDPWTLNWQKLMLDTGAAATTPVRLYEMGNEPDNYGSYDGQEYFDNLWQNVPVLKAYARAQGYGEIFIGGPSWANSYTGNLTDIETWLIACRDEYLATGNRDWIPDFISTHTYLITPTENDTQAHAQARIDTWTTFYADLKDSIDTIFGDLHDEGYPIRDQLRLCDTEYNSTIVNGSTVNDSPTFTDFYMQAMFGMFADANLFIACQFTIASHEGGAFDLLDDTGATKPLYDSLQNQISGTFDLVVNDCSHAQTTDSAILTQGHVLTVQETSHAQSSDALTLTQAHQLAVQDAVHAQNADTVPVTTTYQLVVQDCAHAQSVDSLTLTQAHNLTVQDATQTQAADALTIAVIHHLVIQEAGHGQTVDSLVLTQTHVLAISDTLHGQSVDNIAMSSEGQIGPQDSSHAQLADNVTLVQQHQLQVQDSSHGQLADGVTLVQAHNLVVQDCVHTQTADSLVVTQTHQLQVDDVSHAQTVDFLGLTQTHQLLVDDATHAQLVDSLALTQTYVLAVQAALHAQVTELLVLTANVTLEVQDCAHAHSVGTVHLSLSDQLAFFMWNGTTKVPVQVRGVWDGTQVNPVKLTRYDG